MTLIELLSAKLLADAGLTALVGEKIFPDKAPEGTQAPYVVFFEVDGVPQASYTAKAADVPDDTRLQVDCYAALALDARLVGDAVIAAIGDLAIAKVPDDPSERGLQVSHSLKRAFYDDEAELDRVLLEFQVFR